MTIHENSWRDMYQVVDSPLSNQSVSNRNQHPQTQFVGTVEQRMMIILGFVGLLVFSAVFFRPQTKASAVSSDNVGNSDTMNDASGGETAVGAASIGLNKGISPVFSPEVQYWAPQIVAWAGQHGLDPDMAATIMQIESCGDPQANSYAGAQGLFQVMPFHFAAGEDMLNPDINAQRGLAYYAERLEQTGGDVNLAFAGYNGGHVAAAGNWNSWAEETQRYYVWSKGIYEEAKSGQTQSDTLQQWMQAGGASLCRQASNRLALN